MATKEIQQPELVPEIIGTRVTAFNLIPFFLDPSATEEEICRLYDLTSSQVATARAYVLRNADTALARHLEIEARNSAGNSPELIEKMERLHKRFLRFKSWVADRDRQEAAEKQRGAVASETDLSKSGRLPSFGEWLAEQETLPKLET